MSAGASTSNQESQSQQSQQSQSYVDPMQQGYLQDLYGQAQGYANPAATQAAAYGAQQANAPGLNMAYQGAMGLADPTSQIAAQEASLQAGLGNLYANEINPAIQSNAIAAGGFGGGRQGVAQGIAAGELGNAYTQGLGDITARANGQALSAQAMIPQMAQANYAAAVNPTMAGMGALGMYGGILGAPTILNQSSGQGSTQSSGSSYRMQFGIAN